MKGTKFQFIFLLFILSLPLISCKTTENKTTMTTSTESVNIGDKLPLFTINTSKGISLSSDKFVGRPTVLVFFHTMCGDCQRELPIVQDLYDKYGEKVRFICISRGQVDEDVAAYWEKHNLTLPYSPQIDREIFLLFATTTIPRVYITDTQNIVKDIFIETFELDRLRNAVENAAMQCK